MVIHVVKPNKILDYYHGTIISQYCQISISSLLVYDMITTLDREIEYYWSNPYRLNSLLFFFNRYIGITTALLTNWFNTFNENEILCCITYWSHVVANWITILLIDYILLKRVVALYLHKRNINYALHVLFFLEALIELALLIYVNLYQGLTIGQLADGARICMFVNVVPANWGVAFWIVPMVYEVLLMFLALHRAGQHLRVVRGLSGSRLIKILLKDQAIYFLLVVSCSVANIAANRISGNGFLVPFLLNVLGSPSLLSVLGSHILFHLNQELDNERERSGGLWFDTTTETNSEIRFS